MSETSPSHLTAQAAQATFIEERVEHHEQGAVFHAIDEGGELPRYYRGEYAEWLRFMSPQAAEKVTAKAGMLGRFAVFEAAVDETLARLQAGDPVRMLGSGSKSYVVEMPTDTGIYAVRLVAPPASTGAPAAHVNRYATNMYKAVDKPGTEQLEAIWFNTPLTVSQVAPGEASNKSLTGGRLSSVTPDKIAAHIRNLKLLFNDGMATDTNPANVLYDEQAGFTSIDLGSPKFRSLEQNVGWHLAFLLGQVEIGVPPEDYGLRAEIIDQTRRLLRDHFPQHQASSIDSYLAQAQRILLESANVARRDRHAHNGSNTYAFLRREAENTHTDRPSLGEWQARYAPARPPAVQHPGPPENTARPALSGGESNMAAIHRQLEDARQLLADAAPFVNAGVLRWAITNLEQATAGTDNEYINEALRQLAAATEYVTRAQIAIQASNEHTATYIQQTGTLPPGS